MENLDTYKKQKKVLRSATGGVALVGLTSQTVLAQEATPQDTFTTLEGYANSATTVVGSLIALALGVIAFRYGRKMFNKVG